MPQLWGDKLYLLRPMINQFPHCDARILHAPGECQFCDKHPEWQELRKIWQIAFTGHDYMVTSPQNVITTRAAVLPCPADHIRGENHSKWAGNRAFPGAAPKNPHVCGLTGFGLGMEDTCERCGQTTPKHL